MVNFGTTEYVLTCWDRLSGILLYKFDSPLDYEHGLWAVTGRIFESGEAATEGISTDLDQKAWQFRQGPFKATQAAEVRKGKIAARVEVIVEHEPR